MAKAADAVVLALGTDLSWAREGQDAVNITFSAGQLALVDAVTAAAKAPVGGAQPGMIWNGKGVHKGKGWHTLCPAEVEARTGPRWAHPEHTSEFVRQ